MWTVVLICGFGMAIDPVRIGLAVVLLTRRRPMLNLFAFWLGGIVAGVGVAVGVLLLMREAALVAIRNAGTAISQVRSAIFILDGARLQITLGLLALVVLAVMTARARSTAQVPATAVPAGGGDADTLVEEPPRGVFQRLGGRTQEMLNTDVVWPAFLVGLASSFPPYEGVVLLAFIMASGAAITTQFLAFVLFTLMVLAVIEIPLVAYLAKPEQTLALMLRLQDWLRTYRRQIMQVSVGGTGLILLTQGLAAL
ncbi:GAP family protein [Mycobacterium terramassiliense]|uniref:Membrane protein n=1 Tax=Mycobacterium terramassiliense TaxID=1841859 RepID=A0A2U3N8Y6_9MYCO|nr:GAP family protein [Mycobacterium terramassiliense]SPM27988.1 membrane protein [Mycobacterium terramassiliense]